METIESNYRVARRVYQHLHYDIAEPFFEYVQSMSTVEQQYIEEPTVQLPDEIEDDEIEVKGG